MTFMLHCSERQAISAQGLGFNTAVVIQRLHDFWSELMSMLKEQVVLSAGKSPGPGQPVQSPSEVSLRG